jgi:hypothetical protein
MDDIDSLRSLYKTSVDEIRKYLSEYLAGGAIRETEDFDRDGVVFKRFKKDGAPFRFFVSHEFLSDFSPTTIRSKLQAGRINEKLKALREGHTLFLTTEGTFNEATEGRSLGQWSEDLGGSFGFSRERSALMDRVLATTFNGIPLADMPTELQGEPNYYITYSQEFSDAIITAYLLDAAGYHNSELFSIPGLDRGVDLRAVLADGRTIYIEAKSAQNPTQRRASALREQINVGLRKAIRENEQFSHALQGYFIQITLQRSPSSRGDVDSVVNEIIRFVQSTPLEQFKRGTYVAFDANDFPYLAGLASRVYVTDGPRHISVQEGATSFDPNEPYARALRIIRDTSHRAFIDQPVWLIVSLANTPAEFAGPDEPMKRLPINVNETPFEEIIVGYPGSATKYGRTP